MMARDLESLQDRLPPFSQAEAEAVIAQSLERPVAQAFVEPRSRGRRGLDRAGASRRDRARRRPQIGRGQGAAARRRPRASAATSPISSSSRTRPKPIRRKRGGCGWSRSSTRCRARWRWRWICGWRPRRCRRWRRTPATIRTFACPTVDWDRTAHNVLTMEWIDGIALSDHARLEQSQVDLPDLGRKVIQSFLRHALRDGFFHADMHPGNLFLDDAGRLVAVDFGIMGRLGVKERRFLAEILLRLHHPRLSPRRRGAFRGRLCAGASFGREFRAGDPRHRRADPQPHRRRNLDGEAADAAARGHRPVRHAHPPGTDPAAEDHGGGRGRRARLRSQTRHLEDRRSRGARMDRAQSRSRRPHPGRDVRRRRTRPRAGGPAGDRGAVGGGAGAAGDHDPGRPDAVAGDDRGDGPDRGPQEPLAHAGAVDHRRDLYRRSCSRSGRL